MQAPKPTKPTANPHARKFDHWAAMEPEWRSGVLSKSELGKKYGVSRAAMDKHFNGRGIERDLMPDIQERANSIVANKTAAMVIQEDRAAGVPATPPSDETIIEVNARVQSTIRLRHRQDIDAAKSLFYLLLDELRDSTSNRPLIDELVEVMDEEGNAQDAERAASMRRTLDRVMSSQSRISSAKMLTEMLEKIIRLEREAYGINVVTAEDAAPNSIAAFLAGMKRSALPIVMEVERDASL